MGPQVTEGLNTVWVPSESGLGWGGGQEGGSEGAVLGPRSAPAPGMGEGRTAPWGLPEDRKSTRLNSSH